MQAKRGEPEEPARRAKRRLEAASALVGAALAAATLAVIIWDGVGGEGRPALVNLQAGAVHPHAAGFVVEVVAHNAGDETAADLLVEGTLMRGEEAVETSEATFDYVPSQSRRRGGLVFSQDPRRFELKLRAKGYVEP